LRAVVFYHVRGWNAQVCPSQQVYCPTNSPTGYDQRGDGESLCPAYPRISMAVGGGDTDTTPPDRDVYERPLCCISESELWPISEHRSIS